MVPLDKKKQPKKFKCRRDLTSLEAVWPSYWVAEKFTGLLGQRWSGVLRNNR